ncbi:MAG: hypothetical protein IJD10_01375 [Clostridia bacterium]|nr:hypothetical protein [Clostridia bacterium]
MEQQNEKKRLPRRRITAAVLVTVSILALVFVLLFCFILTQRREEFKKASDYEFVKQYIASSEENAFYDIALAFVERELTVYEDRNEVMQGLSDLLTPDKLTFARAEAYTPEAPVYTLYVEEKEVFTLTLSREGKGLSGYPRWAVAELLPSADCALGHEVIVEVPRGALLTVSGIPVDPSEAENAPYHALTEFETALAEEYRCDRYTLGRFFLIPEPMVVLDGVRLQASSVDDAVLRYDYPPSLVSSVTLTVPYGATVRLNGILLGGEYLAESGVPYPFLTRFEADLPQVPAAAVYQVSGLLRTPVVEVECGGLLLTDDGAGRYRLPESLTKAVTVFAPEGAIVKLNGVSAGAPERVGQKVELPIFEGVTSHAKERPYLVCYQVTGLLEEPVLTATDGKGRALAISPWYSHSGEAFFLCADEGEVPEKELLTVKTFAENYLKYVYGGPDGIGKNYNNAVAMTPAKTPALAALKDLYQGLQSMPSYKSIQFGELTVEHYAVYSDTARSATVSLSFTAKLDGREVTAEATMEILYVYVGNVRRVVNFKVLNTVTDVAE